jgi:hypothetical protein
MKRLALIGSAMLTISIALPAFGAWDEIGRLRVTSDGVRFERNIPMGGPVERLHLIAEGDDIFCRSVRAQFGNGADREIFHGLLRQSRPADIDLPGERRNIRGLSFQCRSEHRGGGAMRVAAEVGRYRDTWRRHPDFGRLWARAFNWGSNLMNDWELLGSEAFSRRRDSEKRFAGWRGRHIDALALKPLDADARCVEVVAEFGNGRNRTLDANHGNILPRGQLYKLDLPGGYRILDTLRLRCRPVNAGRVTIQILMSK